jgi:hypothetical protein
LSRGKTAVIVGAQWGDEGKGKIVDVLTQTFSVVARYAGGHNAGHTVIIEGKKFVLQLVPGGILRPTCMNVIGNGVVFDPIAFLKEVATLREGGVKVDGTTIGISGGVISSITPPGRPALAGGPHPRVEPLHPPLLQAARLRLREVGFHGELGTRKVEG